MSKHMLQKKKSYDGTGGFVATVMEAMFSPYRAEHMQVCLH